MNNVLHGKTFKRWCDTCGTLILSRKCSKCSSEGREFEINNPGEIRPCIGTGVDVVYGLYRKHFGTCEPIKDKAIFLNKIAGEDRSDEIIAHGHVIGVLRFNVLTDDFDLELRQGGAEIFREKATKNVITFAGMSGHLKGKVIPGMNINEVLGEFVEGEPLILIKGTKVGPGTALVKSSEIKEAERAVKIKDMFTPLPFVPSKNASKKEFAECNRDHLMKLESNAVSDVRSFIKGKSQPVTISFSGGKDSLAAYGIASKAVPSAELIFVDTGIEFPETLKYVREFAKENHLKLHKAEAGNAFWENVKTFGPPAKDFRWCCKVCKLGPITELISERFRNGTITIEGNRSLESFARSNTSFVSKNPFVPNQTTLNPIRAWNASEVWGYIWMKGFRYNPMYDKDFERIGCYLCASCLSSEWRQTKKIERELYEEWESFLNEYAKKRKLPSEYVDLGLWRWKVLPPKMLKIAEELNLKQTSESKDVEVKMLKGASPCAAGGYSVEAIVSIPRKRDFSMIEDSLRTVGQVKYSDDFEIALMKNKNGTAKLFGGGQVSITSKDKSSAEELFDRSVKALLRSQLCTECGICARSCNRRAVRIKNGFRTDPEKCNSCGKCEASCMVIHYQDKMTI